MKKIWPFSFYFLYYAALSFFMPLIVLFYQALVFTGPQIALLTGIPPLITLFSAPFWTSIADSRHRPGIRKRRQQCRFTCIGYPDNPYIGDQLELKAQALFFAGLPFFRDFWDLEDGRGKASVPFPSTTTLCDHQPLTALGEVAQELPATFLKN